VNFCVPELNMGFDISGCMPADRQSPTNGTQPTGWVITAVGYKLLVCYSSWNVACFIFCNLKFLCVTDVRAIAVPNESSSLVTPMC
jgi:hypothetical protein